ncbi:hypothetical protein AAP_01518 [Ascosphaera apis ARSEF 7405]|uniref:Uncharacterized protein n=1 Tax=Ascosphaera apis ARSEF 7405 TaxID=392613 RepID=A0A166P8H1_9EURO|nr:hypothetical protein AAP_01518 [Ascosphaera apis ARSEF 7405]
MAPGTFACPPAIVHAGRNEAARQGAMHVYEFRSFKMMQDTIQETICTELDHASEHEDKYDENTDIIIAFVNDPHWVLNRFSKENNRQNLTYIDKQIEFIVLHMASHLHSYAMSSMGDMLKKIFKDILPNVLPQFRRRNRGKQTESV